VIVADNDAAASARQIVTETCKRLGLASTYVVEPRQGIPLVRNRALAAVPSHADFICLIDDDEIPAPHWLDELLFIQKITAAEAVYGPVRTLFPDGTPDWVRAGNFFKSPDFSDGQSISYAGSNNVLISWPFLLRTGLRFDEKFRYSGGSDTLLFMQARKAGMTIAWAAQAEVSETVPLARLTPDWIIRRQYRYGTTLALCERQVYGLTPRLLLRAVKGGGRLLRGAAKFILRGYTGKPASILARADMARGLGMIVDCLDAPIWNIRQSGSLLNVAATTPLPKRRIGGLQTVVTDSARLAGQMVRDYQANQCAARTLPPKIAFSSNGQGIAYYNTEPGFSTLMDQADYIHADGMSVVLASRLLCSTPLPERISTTDFFYPAARAAEDNGLKFFFLGGTEEENRAAVERAHQLYPKLIISGRHNGYFTRAEESRLVRSIVESGTDVLWIALGKPRQEEFSCRNRAALTGVTWIKTCGGLYKFLAGIDKRAPRWMQKAGLEWLFRLIQEPRRLFWRYFVTNFQALWFLLTRTD
jgi:N-acetylglucosaminyldiphosphoundecaprenol N-acetyl-beta-D-mannosaminyltransferase